MGFSTEAVHAGDGDPGKLALRWLLDASDGGGDRCFDQLGDHVAIGVSAQDDPTLGAGLVLDLVEQYRFAHTTQTAGQDCAVRGAGAFGEAELEVLQ